MWHALTWFVVAGLLAVWSVACWAFGALANLVMAHAGTVSTGGLSTQGLSLPAWLAPWVPQEVAYALANALAALGPTLQSVLGQMPSLAGAVGVAMWVVWGLGALLLVLLGLAVTGLIAAARRKRPPPPGAPGAFGGGPSGATR